MPSEVQGKNIVVELVAGVFQEFKTFYSSGLHVIFYKDQGELRVVHKEAKTAVPSVYVKVFAKNKDGTECFFRDGFTDIRGKFCYASSTKNLGTV